MSIPAVRTTLVVGRRYTALAVRYTASAVRYTASAVTTTRRLDPVDATLFYAQTLSESSVYPGRGLCGVAVSARSDLAVPGAAAGETNFSSARYINIIQITLIPQSPVEYRMMTAPRPPRRIDPMDDRTIPEAAVIAIGTTCLILVATVVALAAGAAVSDGTSPTAVVVLLVWNATIVAGAIGAKLAGGWLAERLDRRVSTARHRVR